MKFTRSETISSTNGSDLIQHSGFLFYYCQTLQLGTEHVSESGAKDIKELKQEWWVLVTASVDPKRLLHWD